MICFSLLIAYAPRTYLSEVKVNIYLLLFKNQLLVSN